MKTLPEFILYVFAMGLVCLVFVPAFIHWVAL